MKFTKKGNHVLVESSSRSKLRGEPNEYRITPLECPVNHGHGVLLSGQADDVEAMLEPKVHWICSCPDFMMGRISRGINPLANPCKHIVGFLLSESAQGERGDL